jgi:hypothetical protein
VSESAETAAALERPASIWSREFQIWPTRLHRVRSTAGSPALRAVLGSRLLVWVAALVVIYLFGENVTAWFTLDPFGLTAPFHSIPLDKLIAPGARWDSVWYLQIANQGYFNPGSTNFFPLYPLLIGIGSDIFGQPLLVGIAISVTSMFVALTVLYRLALLDLDERAARLTIVLVSLYPMSFFLSAVYAESLFLALSVSALYAARRERWALAGLFGGLSAATRSDGIMLLLPLVLLYLYGPRADTAARSARAASAWWRPRFAITRSAAWLALVPAGLAAYLGYLGITHGAPLAPYHAAQADWGRFFGGPFGAVVRLLLALPGDIHGLLAGTARPVGPGDPLNWNAHDLIDLGFFAVAIAAVAVSWRRVPFAYFAYAVTIIAYGASFPYPHAPLQALPRYLLPIFPLFMGSAAWLSERRKTRWAVLVTSGALLLVFSGLWAFWTLIP